MFKRKFRTDSLFSRTGLLIGAGSVFSLAGNYFVFNYSDSPLEADTRAIASDWGVIGQDIQGAMDTYEQSVALEQSKQLVFDFDGR
jgi:hypothetical protein